MYGAAGVLPHQILPITVDVGCNTDATREDPLYIGLRQNRVRGKEYDSLLDELVAGLRQRYGPSLLIHWEDLSAANSFRTLARLQQQVIFPPHHHLKVSPRRPQPLTLHNEIL